jgi:hypothetical protein
MIEHTTKTALILNSRQSKQPVGSDQWVVNTIAAAKYAADNGYTLICSYGMNTWELLTYLSSKLSAKAIVLVLDTPETEIEIIPHLMEQYRLDNGNIDFHRVHSTGKSKKSWWINRDETAVELSDLILPVSINPSGNLWGMIGEIADLELLLDERFAIAHKKSAARRYAKVNESSLRMERSTSWNYITHWTRSFDGPWPDQNAYDYYDMLIAHTTEYSHGAINTLRRILKTGRIYGSSNHIRGGFSVVSLTDHHPVDAVKLMKWRARFVRLNFEPYGIAIDHEFAQTLGIRPVIYGMSNTYSELPIDDKPFFQNLGEKAGDWEPEQEWRHCGDIDLSLIPSDKMKIIVRRQSEIETMRELTSSEIIALTDEDN